jgi:hypothetical protein
MIETIGNVAFWFFVLLVFGNICGEFLKANATVVAEPTPEQRDDYHYHHHPLPAMRLTAIETDRTPARERFRVPPFVIDNDEVHTGPVTMLDETQPIAPAMLIGADYQSNGRYEPPTRTAPE